MCNGWGTVGAGETSGLPLAGSLPPQLQGQVQSCYSLEQWQHLSVTKEQGAKDGRGGLFQRNPHWLGNYLGSFS